MAWYLFKNRDNLTLPYLYLTNEEKINSFLDDLPPYQLSPWSRVVLEKLIVTQLVKKFSTFCGTRRFITVLTRARQLSLF